jgi:hypothetical protein
LYIVKNRHRWRSLSDQRVAAMDRQDDVASPSIISDPLSLDGVTAEDATQWCEDIGDPHVWRRLGDDQRARPVLGRLGQREDPQVIRERAAELLPDRGLGGCGRVVPLHQCGIVDARPFSTRIDSRFFVATGNDEQRHQKNRARYRVWSSQDLFW